MRTHQPRNSALTDEERKDPAVRDLLDVFGKVGLIEELYPKAYALRDDMLAALTGGSPQRGESRGLSTRLAREVGLTPEAVKSAKLKAKRRRDRGESLDDRHTRAVRAALDAAAAAYQQALDSDDDGDAPA